MYMGKKSLIMLVSILWTVGTAAQQDEEGLLIDKQTTITDVSPYQGTNVNFAESEYFDVSTNEYIMSMGSITLDAPTSPRWQINRFTFPIDFFNFMATYDWETGEQKTHINKIATILNKRTPVEANEILVRLPDQGYEEWLFFSVPFDVNVDDIRGGIGQWVIRRYDGEKRAAAKAGETWVDVRAGDMLHAGEGYIFMRHYDGLMDEPGINWEEYEETQDDYTLILPAANTANKQNMFRTDDIILPLKHYSAERSTNADWNMLGNPYPTYYDVSAIPEKTLLYVWDYDAMRFRTLSTGEHNDVMLAPGQPFFVQADGLSQLTFPASGRRTEGRFDFEIKDDGGDDDWGDDDWGDEDGDDEDEMYVKARQARRTALDKALAIRKSKAHGPSTTFNPANPGDPGANYYNPITGEAVFDMVGKNGILLAAFDLFDNPNMARNVKKVTMLASPGNYFLFSLFTDVEIIDMSRSWGFTKVPEQAFSYLMKLREISLPSCVEEIDDCAFEFCMALEQMDIYAQIPPKVSEKTFSNMMTNLENMIIRVPAEAVETYKQADVWKKFNILPLEGGNQELKSMTVEVKAPDGSDLTSQCSILWTNGAGEVLGTGQTLTAQPVGTEVNYSIGLQPSIANLYYPVSQGSCTVQPDGNTIIITLEPTGVIDLGNKEFRGSSGRIEITFIPSDVEAPGIFNPNDAILTVFDKETGRELSDLVMQYPSAKFEQTELQPGQAIQIEVNSRSNSFTTTRTEVMAAADGSFTAEIQVKENGVSIITCTMDAAVSEAMALVFDAEGRFLARYNGDSNVIRVNSLPDGAYQAVVMQQNPYLTAIATLDDLKQTTLRKEQDYNMVDIQQAAGIANRYEAVVHPIDMSQIGHISNQTYITTNDNELSIAANATLRAKVVFKQEYAAQISNVQLIIDIPEGMSYVENSIISTAGSLQQNGQRLIVPCTPGEQIKWSLASTRSGQKTIPAMVQYIMGGQQYLVPVGAATVQVTGLTLDVVSITNRAQVNVRGYALGGSQVTIYDGRNIVARTTAKGDGYYTADITLNPAYDGTMHRLYADVEVQDRNNISTETSIVRYDRNASMLTNVSMIFQDKQITWNELTGDVTPNFYNINPELSDMVTFTARLDNPKPECILDPYFDVLANDGTRRTFDAHWNETKRMYTATGRYTDIFCMPAEVQFIYTYADSTEYSRQELFDAEVNTLVNAHNELVEGVEKCIQMGNIVTNDENCFSAEFNIGEEDKFMMTLRTEDFNRIMNLRDELERPIIRTIMEGDTVVSFFIANNERSTTVYFANQTKQEAYSETINTQTTGQVRARKISWGGIVGGIKDFFAPTPSNLSNINGLIDKANGKLDDANKALEALRYIDEMQAQYDEFNNDLSNRINVLQYLLLARCPNGDMRVPSSLYGSFQEQIRRLDDNRKVYCKQMQGLILSYCNALENAGYKEIAKELTKFAAKFYAKQKLSVKSGQLSQNMAKTGIGTAEEFGSFLKDGINSGIDAAMDAGIDQIAKWANIPTDYAGVRKFFEKWAPKTYHEISMRVTDLRFTITASYEECKEEEIQRPPVPWAKQKRRICPIVDPSGYVYEGVQNNRVEGVTATIYYKKNEGEAEQQWDATEFGQQNPQTTDAQGLYMWNVPNGLWQVRFQKDGYEPAQTDWLPVPPPQLDIAVSMVNRTAPEVTAAEATPEQVTIRFSRFMDMASLGSVSVKQNGNIIAGTLEAMNGEQGRADHVRFRPSQTITAQQVELIVPTEARSYAGTPMQEDYEAVLPVRTPIESLLVEEGAAIGLGQTGTVQVLASPAQAVAGRKLRLSILTPILEQAESEITFDEAGRAEVTLRGILPGTADIVLAVADMEARATVEVKYSLTGIVSRPIANIADGTVVGPGSSVMLFSSTPGATIYYTTDGSCPCDSGSRLMYTGPVEITGEMTIQAIAVREGMEDSEVVTLHYTVGDGLGVDGQTAGEVILSQDYYDMSGRRVIRPLRRGMYIQVRRTPNGIRSEKILIR